VFQAPILTGNSQKFGDFFTIDENYDTTLYIFHGILYALCIKVLTVSRLLESIAEVLVGGFQIFAQFMSFVSHVF
jgi:hypothetical protein